MIEELLFKVGIPTYKTSLETELDGKASVTLGQEAPTNIGWIYGIALNIEGTAPDASKTLVTLGEAGGLWLNFKIGTNVFIQQLRMSNLVYNFPNINTLPRAQNNNYMPCSIPLELDWKQSTIDNPGNLTGKFVLIDLWYIDKPSYNQLLKSGVMWKTGIKPQV